MSAEHAHGAHSHDGPPGGAGWIVLDAIVCATAAALLGLFAEWWIQQRRAARARAALLDMDRPAPGPLVDMEALRQYVEREQESRGQAQPDPGPAKGAGD